MCHSLLPLHHPPTPACSQNLRLRRAKGGTLFTDGAKVAPVESRWAGHEAKQVPPFTPPLRISVHAFCSRPLFIPSVHTFSSQVGPWTVREYEMSRLRWEAKMQPLHPKALTFDDASLRHSVVATQ